MIATVADLLREIVARSVPQLDAESIAHGPTIGQMYEGLTASLLETAASFRGIELDVVSGFLEGYDGTQSPQLDCMVVVVGDGRRIPYTDNWVYPVESAIGVVEVKKNLAAPDISDAFEKMRTVATLRPETSPIRMAVVRRNFETLARRAAPEDWQTMPEPWRTIFATVLLEAALPARIVLGYHGHKTAKGFRTAVVRDVEKRIGELNAGPLSFPTAVISERHAIVKTDGLPYTSALHGKDHAWRLLVSSAEPPLRVLLEVVWTRLTMRFGEPPGLFGEDLDNHKVLALVDAVYHPEKSGWQLDAWDNVPVPRDPEMHVDGWVPCVLTIQEATLASWMCKHDDEVNTADPEVESLLPALAGLVEKGLVGPHVSDATLYRLLTRELTFVVGPDGLIYAADNASGKLSRWLAHKLECGVAQSEPEPGRGLAR